MQYLGYYYAKAIIFHKNSPLFRGSNDFDKIMDEN